jgi:hypothetical protein
LLRRPIYGLRAIVGSDCLLSEYNDGSMDDPTGVTGLLLAWSSGDEAARDRLFEAVYDELRRLASAR